VEGLESRLHQHVKMSFGRNGVQGISSCMAMVPVIWSDREDILVYGAAVIG